MASLLELAVNTVDDNFPNREPLTQVMVVSPTLTILGAYSMFSMIDPKGERPKIQGKSHSFSIGEQQQILAREYENKVWPALTVVSAEPYEPIEVTP